MATLSDVIYTHLVGVPSVTDITGHGSSARIFPVNRTQGTANPSITFQRVTSSKVSAMGVDTGLTGQRYQIDCYADTYREVQDLSEAVRGALQRWRGTVLGVTVQQTVLLNTQDLSEPSAEEHRISMDFMFWHIEETTPYTFTIAFMSDNHIPISTPDAKINVARCVEWAVDNAVNLVAMVCGGDSQTNPTTLAAGDGYDTWIRSTGALPANIPVLPVIGNHDTRLTWSGGVYDSTLDTCHSGIMGEYSDLFQGNEWYSWEHGGQVQIAVINNLTDYLSEAGYAFMPLTNMYHNCNPPGAQFVLNPDHSGITVPGSDQRVWLDATMASGHPWKIICCHRAMWVPFNSDPRKMNKLARPAMAVPIDLGCSLICQGDTHIGSLAGPYYPTAPLYEDTVAPGGVGAYSLSLTGTYQNRLVDTAELPAGTVRWSSGSAGGATHVRKCHVALLEVVQGSETSTLTIFEVRDGDLPGSVVHTETIYRNPGA